MISLFVLFIGGIYVYFRRTKILAGIVEKSGVNARMSKIEQSEKRFSQEANRRLNAIEQKWTQRVQELERLMDYNYQARDYIDKVSLTKVSEDPDLVASLPKLGPDHWNQSAKVFSRYLANKHLQKVYARQPRREIFHGAHISDNIKEQSFYEITLLESDTNQALYRLIDNPEKLKMALTYPGDYLFAGCEVSGPPGEIHETTILEYTYGILQKQGENWKITKKAELRYLFDTPDWNIFGILDTTTDKIREKSNNQLSKSELKEIVKEELSAFNKMLKAKGADALASKEDIKKHTKLAIKASQGYITNRFETEAAESTELKEKIKVLEADIVKSLETVSHSLAVKNDKANQDVANRISTLQKEVNSNVDALKEELKKLGGLQKRLEKQLMEQKTVNHNP